MPPGCHDPIVSPLLQKILASALLTLRKQGRRGASPLGSEQLCNQPCHGKLPIRQATLPSPPVLSAHQGKGLPQDPMAVEDLQGASPTQEVTVHGRRPNLLHGSLCPVRLCVLQPCDEPLSHQKKLRKPWLAPSQLATQHAVGIAGAV